MIDTINSLFFPIEKWISHNLRYIRFILLGMSFLTLPFLFLPSFQKETGEQALNVLWFILFLPIFSKVIGLSLATILMRLRKELGILMGTLAWVHSAAYIIEYPTWILDPLFWWSEGFITYFVVGLLSLLLVTPLLLTSSEWAMKKLGRYWKLIHRLVYFVVIFTVLHVVLIKWTQNGMIEIGGIGILVLYFIGKGFEWSGFTLKKSVGYQKGQKWLCIPCGYIYDPAIGDEDSGIAAGTEFTDIPDTWSCPVCGVKKSDFIPYEGGGENIKKYTAILTEKKLLNETTVELTIETEVDFESKIGQFMSFLWQDKDGEFTRSYSIAKQEGKRYTFLIKLGKQSRATPLLLEIATGTQILLKGVFGSFVLQHTSNPKIFIATGTGLAPIYRMLCTLPADEKKILYFSVATLAELFYEKELRSIPNLDLFIHITREDIVGYEKGRIESDSIEASEDTEWYLCGNPKMVEDTCKKLSAKGFTRIYTEEFN